MRIVSYKLAPLLEKAYDLVREKYGDGKSILIYGVVAELQDDPEGKKAAVFYPIKGDFYLDQTAVALRAFTGDPTAERKRAAGIMISDSMRNQWRDQQTALIREVKKVLMSEGKDPETASMEAAFMAARFGSAEAGHSFGGVYFDDIPRITENALKNGRSVVVKISKEFWPDWDGHLMVEIQHVEKE